MSMEFIVRVKRTLIVIASSFSFGIILSCCGDGEGSKSATTSTESLTFIKSYGGSEEDMGVSAQQTTDGGYIIAGSTDSFGAGSKDVYLIKTDARGNVAWYKTFGGEADDYGGSVQQTSDGGYIIAGHTDSFGSGKADVYLIKTDKMGDAVWSKTFGGEQDDIGISAQQTSDGGYIIVGGTGSFGAGGSDVYLIKTDAMGNTVWYKTYGGLRDDMGIAVQQTSDNGFIIAGYTDSFGSGDSDVYLIRTNAM